MEAQHQPASSEPSNQLIARAYLSEAGDRKNRLLLTEQSLQVYYRGKSRAFSLAYIQYLSIEHRKLWLPLIGGGILASLCLLALFHTFNMPYRLLSGTAVGLFCMWWGYRGSMAVVVHEQRHHTDYLVAKPSPDLPVFIAFANRLIGRYPHALGEYCIPISIQEWEELQKRGFLQLSEPRRGIPLEIAERKRAEQGYYWAVFDPFMMGERLKWLLQGQELVAQLEGEVEAGELRLLING